MIVILLQKLPDGLGKTQVLRPVHVVYILTQLRQLIVFAGRAAAGLLQIGGHQTVGLRLAQQGVHRAVCDVNVLGEIVGYLVAVAVLSALGTLRYSELRREMGNVAAGAATNIALDAALATVIAQGVSAGLVVRYLCTGGSILRLRLRNIRSDGKLLWLCILLGTSPALMQLTENLVAISFNTSLQTYGGDMAVASMSILSSVMQFVMLLLPGAVQGAQPLLSYNLGAGDISRVKKTFRLLLACCVSGSFLIRSLCMAVPGAVASIFTNDAALIEYTKWSVRVYLAALLIYGVQVACQYSFVALDQAPKAIFLTIWREIILLIPLIFLLPRLWPNAAAGVYLAEPIADTVAVCTTAPMFYTYYRKLK